MSKLLYTGGSGFLGLNTIDILKAFGFNVSILARNNANLSCNLSKETPSLSEKYDIILHAAGKAHSIPRSEEDKKQFYDINLQGTINLCKGLEKSSIPDHFIFISTVAVYGLDSGTLIDENTPLNGNSPYALSKIMAEDYLTKWSASHNVKLSILRPSLIAGSNPLGNLRAMIEGLKNDKYFRIGKGDARKSILMASDIAHLVPLLIKSGGGIFNICDDHHPSFKELEDIICIQLNRKSPISIPYPLAKSMALIGDIFGNKAPINSSKLAKIVNPLTFNNQKAKTELGWEPLDVLSNFRIN